jgi:hypothetical protein
MSKGGGSKVLTAVIAFILGFIFAVVFEIAAIFGVGYYVLNTDLNTLFSMVGFENKDENGVQYINTDESTGGVTTAVALVGKLQEAVDGIGAYSLGQLEELFPAVDGLTTGIFDSLNEYVEISKEEVKATQFMDLPTYLENKIMQIQPAVIMRKMEMGDTLDNNEIIKALLEGNEASYVTDGTLKYPVYYDEYTKVDNGVEYKFNRTLSVNGMDPYPETLASNADYWLVDMGENIYRQYFIPYGEGYLATTLVDGSFVFDSTAVYLTAYGDDGVSGRKDDDGNWKKDSNDNEIKPRLTGNYYYDNEGNQVFVNAVTLATLSSNPMEPLDNFALTKLFEGQDLIAKVFGDTTLGDLINNRVDFEKLINDVELSTIIDISPDNSIFAYLGYKVSNISKVEIKEGEEAKSYSYTASYEMADGSLVNCFIETSGEGDDEHITRVYYNTESGVVEVACCKVSEIADVIQNIKVTALLSIKADDAIMMYLGYGVYNLEVYTADGYSYKGKIATDGNFDNGTTVLISMDAEGIVNGVYVEEDKTPVSGTTVDDMSDRIGNITKALKIKDVITLDENSSKFMVKISDLYINNVADAVDILTINDFLSPKSSETLLMYVTYGISNISKDAVDNDGTVYSAVYWNADVAEPIYIKNDKDSGEIVGFYTDLACSTAKEITGTHIQGENGISSIVGSLTTRLTLSEIVTVEKNNTFLYAIRNSTIDGIPTAILNLGLQEVFTSTIYGEDVTIMQVVADSPAEGQIKFDSSYIYYVKNEDGTYTFVNDDSETSRGKLTANDLSSGTYYTYGKPKGAWLFMLSEVKLDADGNSYKSEKVYTVNDMGKLMSNVTDNVQKATIAEMRDAGLLNAQIDASVPVERVEVDGTVVFYIRAVDNCTVDQLIGSIEYLVSEDYAKAVMKIDGYICKNESEKTSNSSGDAGEDNSQGEGAEETSNPEKNNSSNDND